MKISIQQSGTKKSAESKKCNWLKKIAEVSDLAERTKLGKILAVHAKYDLELGKVLTQEEIDEVVKTGARPGRGKGSKGGIVVEIEI